MKVDFKGYYSSVFCFSQEELRLLRNNADKAKYDHRGSKATLDFGDFKLIQYHMGYDNHRYFISVDSQDKEFEISPTQYNTVQNIFMKFYHEYFRNQWKSEIDKTCKAVGRWKYNLEKENKSTENNA